MTPVVQTIASVSRRLMALTLDQYHQMVEKKILAEGEPYELLNGVLVHKDRSASGEDPMTVGSKHAWVITKLVQLESLFRRSGCHLRIQLPIEIPPASEPEPDAAIVRGSEDDYLDQTPVADDTCCVIEVADASLSVDRTAKLAIYANGGIPLYLIINIPDRCIEVYSEPLKGKGRYARSATLTGNQRLELPTGSSKKVGIPARRVIP